MRDKNIKEGYNSDDENSQFSN